jgi:hypothetical protein
MKRRTSSEKLGEPFTGAVEMAEPPGQSNLLEAETAVVRAPCYYGGVKTSSLAVLEKEQLPAGQARAILTVMESEMEERDRRLYESLAKKEDFVALKVDFMALKHDLELKIDRLGAELRAELADQRVALAAQGTKIVFWMFGMFVALASLLLAVRNHRVP